MAHLVTALNWGKPPPRRARSPTRQSRPKPEPPTLSAEELDAYAAVLLDFREWCERRDVSFKGQVIAAVRQHMRAHA
jgi:hypothetical protein